MYPFLGINGIWIQCFRSWNIYKANMLFFWVLLLREEENNQTYGPITGWVTLHGINSNQLFVITCSESFPVMEEFSPTYLCRIVLVQPLWRVFEHGPPF